MNESFLYKGKSVGTEITDSWQTSKRAMQLSQRRVDRVYYVKKLWWEAEQMHVANNGIMTWVVPHVIVWLCGSVVRR